MTARNYVEFVHVDKSYDGRTLVVDDLNLEIAKGEFLTMLGPSGSGKTTSLMMLAGFEAPSVGRILLAGKSLVEVPPYRRNIGMVFQNYALFPHLSVAENLAYPLSVRQVSKAESAERVRRILDMVKMSAFAERKPGQLSGGQQQRIALARAIIFEPDLVLMDEPLGALDKNLREHLQLEIKHLHDELGITVVYVTHDQSEALTMSDRVAVFNEGRIEQLAPPSELYEHPATPFVAGFIGENNRISGRIVARDDSRYTVETASGTRLCARSERNFALDQPILLSLRPERVRLGDDGADGENRLTCTVKEIIYLGDHRRIHLRLGDDTEIVAKVANTAGLGGVADQAEAIVSWGGADMVMLADGKAG